MAKDDTLLYSEKGFNLLTLIGWIAPAFFLNGLMPFMGRVTQQITNESTPNDIPQVPDAVAMKVSGVLPEEMFDSVMLKQGMNPIYHKMYEELAAQKHTPLDYVMLWKRGEISESQMRTQLKRLRMQDFDIEQAINLFKFIPGPQDIIRFAVREVFSPEIAEKFGQFEQFPEDFVREAAKVGMSEEVAKWFWGAHWELPSLTQGYEMYHRTIENKIDEDADTITLPSGKTVHNVIGTKTLDKLMRAQDVMPFWRDKLREISYNPLTRVDVRRMYGLGVIDEDEVFKNFLDSGYSPENAARMTAFTVKYESHEFDDITRANVVSAYVDGLITENELKEYLRGMGMVDKIIDFWLEDANYKKTLEEIKAEAQELSDQYQMGLINLDTVKIKLGALNVRQDFIDGVVNKLIKKQAVRSKLPDKNDLVKWLGSGTIDDRSFSTMMKGQGYRDDAIQAYLTNAHLEDNKLTRKFLSESKYQSWLEQGIMNREEFTQVLLDKGLSIDDINRMILEVS